MNKHEQALPDNARGRGSRGVRTSLTGEVEPGANSNKWYHTWAETRGVSAQVSTNDGTFSLADVPLYPGTNHLVVTVTDVSGNTAEQTRTVVRSFPESFHYDGNGNLTNWVQGAVNWVYEWDWADRLTKVTSNNVVVLENWYDANSRRIAKKEWVGGQTEYTLYVWDGWDSVAVLDESAQVVESFTRGVGLAGDIGSLVAVTHHAASSTNGTFYTHHNHRGDVVLTRSGSTTVGSYDYTAFGSLKSQNGPDVSRFKFSSKESDASTGFSYYGYRFYAPQWQRWLRRDPLEELGGLNVYSFVGNNPLTRIDPLGLKWSETAQAIWISFGYAVPGSEIPAAAGAAADCVKIAIIQKFKEACMECLPDPDCKSKICEEYERVKAKLQPPAKKKK